MQRTELDKEDNLTIKITKTFLKIINKFVFSTFVFISCANNVHGKTYVFAITNFVQVYICITHYSHLKYVYDVSIEKHDHLR